MAKFLDENGVKFLWNKLKESINNINNLIDVPVDCDHELEITGQTNHEYGLAIPTETNVKIERIAGQTGKRSKNEWKFKDVSFGPINASSSDGYLSLNGSNSGGSQVNSYGVYDRNSKYSVRISKISGELTGSFKINICNAEVTQFDKVYTFTPDSDSIGMWINPDMISTTALKLAVMLVKGEYTDSTMPAFQEYDNTLVNAKVNQLISSDMNLIDPNKWTPGEKGSVIQQHNKIWHYKLDLPVGTYTFRINNRINGGSVYVARFRNGKYVDTPTNWTTSGGVDITASDEMYLNYSHSGSSSDVTLAQLKEMNIMLNYGGSPEDYVPYEEDKISLGIELGADDYINPNTNENVKQRSSFTTIDGSSDEGWYRQETTSGNWRFVLQVANDIDTSTGTINTVSNWIDVTGDATWNGKSGISANNDTINVCNMSYSDVASFKQWLKENPITLSYKLKTPIITQIITPAGFKAWNSGLQIQEVASGYLPYIITKEYAISVLSQVKNNIDININQQKQIDELKQMLLALSSSIKEVE